MVAGWFRPTQEEANRESHPLACYTTFDCHRNPMANLFEITTDLELYNIRTDAFGLIALAMLTLILTGAVPMPGTSANASTGTLRPYAKAAIWSTVFHHVTTGALAFQQYIGPGYTKAMAVGVYGSGGLALLGLYTLMFGMGGQPKSLKAKM